MNAAHKIAALWAGMSVVVMVTLSLGGEILEYAWLPLFAVGASVVYGAAGAIIAAIEEK